MSIRGCSHLDAIESIKGPQRRECEECVKIGSYWVHLRTCQTCGVTLCCDSSPNRHASKHAHQSGHPVFGSAHPGEHCHSGSPAVALPENRIKPVQMEGGSANVKPPYFRVPSGNL